MCVCVNCPKHSEGKEKPTDKTMANIVCKVYDCKAAMYGTYDTEVVIEKDSLNFTAERSSVVLLLMLFFFFFFPCD